MNKKRPRDDRKCSAVTMFPLTINNPDYFSSENVRRDGMGGYPERDFNETDVIQENKKTPQQQNKEENTEYIVKNSPKELPPRKDLRRSLIREEDRDLVLSSSTGKRVIMDLTNLKMGLSDFKSKIACLGDYIACLEVPVDQEEVRCLVGKIEASVDFVLGLDNTTNVITDMNRPFMAAVSANAAKSLLDTVDQDLLKLSRIVANSLVSFDVEAVQRSLGDFNSLRKELNIYREVF